MQRDTILSFIPFLELKQNRKEGDNCHPGRVQGGCPWASTQGRGRARRPPTLAHRRFTAVAAGCRRKSMPAAGVASRQLPDGETSGQTSTKPEPCSSPQPRAHPVSAKSNTRDPQRREAAESLHFSKSQLTAGPRNKINTLSLSYQKCSGYNALGRPFAEKHSSSQALQQCLWATADPSASAHCRCSHSAISTGSQCYGKGLVS